MVGDYRRRLIGVGLNMKKILLILICVGLLTSCSVAETNPDLLGGNINVSGTPIEFDSWNQGGALLVRKDDALYYVYNKSTVTMKIVRISANGTEEIYKAPSSPLSVEGSVRAPSIMLYDGKIIAFEEDRIVQYNESDKVWAENDSLSNRPYLFGRYFDLGGSYVYAYSEKDPEKDYSYRHYIGHYTDGAVQRYDNDLEYLAEYYPKRHLSFADESFLYYVQHNLSAGEQQQYEIRRYAINTKTEELLFSSEIYPAVDPKEYLVSCADDEWVVFKTRFAGENHDCTVYALNTTVSDAFPVELFTTPEEVRVEGVYNGSVFIAGEGGVVRHSLDDGKQTTLTDRPATECYILDDTWVYFVSDNASLWRVSQDGQTEEHVYG